MHFGKRIILTILLFMSAGIAGAVDRLVPNQYPTIQSAINACSNGDSVTVSPGTYFENINFLGKAIHVKSTNPTDWTTVLATRIDANFSGSVVTFNSSETSSSILEGFQITNGSASSGGG